MSALNCHGEREDPLSHAEAYVQGKKSHEQLPYTLLAVTPFSFPHSSPFPSYS